MKKYLLQSKKSLSIYIFFVTAVASCNAGLPFAVKNLVDLGISKNYLKFINALIIAFTIILLTLVTEYFRKIYTSKIIKELSINIKDDIFKKIITRSHKNFNDANSTEYTSILINDINLIKNDYFLTLTAFIQTTVQLIIYTYAIFKLNPIIAIVMISLSSLPLIIPKMSEKKLSNKKKLYSDKLSIFTTKTSDIFSGFEIIKSFNITERITTEFSKINKESEEYEFYYDKYYSFLNIITGFFSYLVLFATLVIGAYLLLKSKITAGTFTAAISMMDVVNMPIRDIAYELMNFKAIKPVKEKILNIINENTNTEKNNLNNIEFLKKITLKDVTFSYNKEDHVLQNISFCIEKGLKYAIVGQSGSGKSTLIKILLNYYDDYTGNVLLDGNNYKELDSSTLYNIFSVIHQDIFLFDTTIKENICLFNEYSKTSLDNALASSGLLDTITNLKEGIDTYIGENGNTLSGGEKQRIAIARALIRDTPIVVLDEATSSLDNQTAFHIESTLLNIEGLTTIVVTHKLMPELLLKYDKIIVLKEGSIVEVGAFNELIKNKGYFYNLYSIQQNEKNN